MIELTPNFLLANNFVSKWEGFWDDDPDDPGGATKYGICLRLLREQPDSVLKLVRLKQPIGKPDVKGLTKADSELLFNVLFWKPYRLDEAPKRIAIALHDYAVNCGGVTAVKALQRTYNKLYPDNQIEVDGKVGPKTLEAMKKMENTHDIEAFLEERRQRYHNIVSNKPKMNKFLKGWLNRVNDLEKLLAKV